MNQEKIGKFIAEKRREKKMSQKELAEKLKVTDRSVSNWENGKNMPDLALFKPLCEELGITINDLMSGEKVDDEEYQEKLAENVVSVVAKVRSKNKYANIILWIYLIVISFILLFLLSWTLLNYNFKQSYDEKNMLLVNDDNNENLTFYTSYNGIVNYVITKHLEEGREVGLIFINYKSSILNLLEKDNNTSSNLTNSRLYNHNIDLLFANLPFYYKVYYTDINLSKINNATEKELEKIIKNSNLIYESNDKLTRD